MISLDENTGRIVDQDIYPAELLEKHGDENCNQCSPIPSLGEQLIHASLVPAARAPSTKYQFISLAEQMVNKYHIMRGLDFGAT